MTNYNFNRVLTIVVASLLTACETVDTRDKVDLGADSILVSQYPINKKLEIANNEYEQGALFEAEKNYLNILSDNPGISDAWFKLGNIYYRSGRYKAAVNAYQSVLKLDNRHNKAWYNLSLTRVSQAVETIDISLEILDEDTEAYVRGLLLKKNLLNRISAVENEEIRNNSIKANQDYQIGQRLNKQSTISDLSQQYESTTEDSKPSVVQSPIILNQAGLVSSPKKIGEQTEELIYENVLSVENTESVRGDVETANDAVEKDLENQEKTSSENEKPIVVASPTTSHQTNLDSNAIVTKEQELPLSQTDDLISENVASVENTEAVQVGDKTENDFTEQDLKNEEKAPSKNEKPTAVDSPTTSNQTAIGSDSIVTKEKELTISQADNLLPENVTSTENTKPILADEKIETDSSVNLLNSSY